MWNSGCGIQETGRHPSFSSLHFLSFRAKREIFNHLLCIRFLVAMLLEMTAKSVNYFWPVMKDADRKQNSGDRKQKRVAKEAGDKWPGSSNGGDLAHKH